MQRESLHLKLMRAAELSEREGESPDDVLQVPGFTVESDPPFNILLQKPMIPHFAYSSFSGISVRTERVLAVLLSRILWPSLYHLNPLST